MIEPTTSLPRLEAPGVFAEPLARGEAARWLIFAVMGFVAGQLLSVGAATITAALLGKHDQLSVLAKAASPPEWFILSSLLGLWVGFLAAPAFALRFGGVVRRHLGFSFRPIDLLGVPIGIASQLIVALIYQPFIHHIHNFDAPVKRLTGASHGGGFFWIALFTIIGAPIAEEVFFRGLLFRGLLDLGDRMRPSSATSVWIICSVLIDGLLFGLSHGELAQLAGLALFGALLAFLFLRTGRLGMSILSHAAFNGLAIAAIAVAPGRGWW